MEQYNSERVIAHLNAGGFTEIFEMFGLIVNYSPEQIQPLEALFLEICKVKGSNDELILMCGLYLGETIIRNIPGTKWTNLQQDNPVDIEITVPTKSFESYKIKPIRRFARYLEDNTNSPATFYWLTEMLTRYHYNQLMDIGEPLTDGWYKFEGGHIIRLRKIPA